jgi:hypothetical protein
MDESFLYRRGGFARQENHLHLKEIMRENLRMFDFPAHPYPGSPRSRPGASITFFSSP